MTRESCAGWVLVFGLLGCIGSDPDIGSTDRALAGDGPWEFSYTGCSGCGSSENPNAVGILDLCPNGKACQLFDDIVMCGTYSIEDEHLRVSIDERTAVFTIAEDGTSLETDGGTTFTLLSGGYTTLTSCE